MEATLGLPCYSRNRSSGSISIFCCGGGLVAKSCPTFFSDIMDYSPPVSSVHWIPQAGLLEWVASSFSRGSSLPGEDEPRSPALAGGVFTTEPPGKPITIFTCPQMLGAGALGRPRGMVRGGRREEGSGWGTRVYLWRIHFDIWQN